MSKNHLGKSRELSLYTILGLKTFLRLRDSCGLFIFRFKGYKFEGTGKTIELIPVFYNCF